MNREIPFRQPPIHRVAPFLLALIFVVSCGSSNASSVQETTTSAQPSASTVAIPGAINPQWSGVNDFGLVGASGGFVLTDRLFLTLDNGLTWSDVTPSSALSGLVGAHFVDPERGVSVAPSSTFHEIELMVTKDGGKSWSEPETVDVLTEPGSAEFTSYGNGESIWVLVKMVTSSNFNNGVLLVTNDAGVSWTQQAAPSGGSISVSDDGSSAVIVGGPAFDQVFHSGDGGKTWATVEAPAEMATLGQPAHMGDKPLVTGTSHSTADAVVTAYELDISSGNWAILDSFVLPSGFVFEPGAAVPTDFVLSNLIAVAPDGSRIRNGAAPTGVSELAPNGLPGNIVDVAFFDASFGWALAQSGVCGEDAQGCLIQFQILSTLDGGQTWSPLVPPA